MDSLQVQDQKPVNLEFVWKFAQKIVEKTCNDLKPFVHSFLSSTPIEDKSILLFVTNLEDNYELAEILFSKNDASFNTIYPIKPNFHRRLCKRIINEVFVIV
jgi:hypothetical protein